MYGYGGGYFPYYSPVYPYYDYDYYGPAAYVPPRNIAALPPIPNDHPGTARLLLKVPAGAEVWVQGRQYDVGPNHLFESPELKPDETFTFDVRVIWQEKGKKIEEKRTLKMKAGDYQNLQY